MTENILNQILLNTPNEPELIVGASNISIPSELTLPETWMQALSRDIPSSDTLLNIWEPLVAFMPQLVEIIVDCTIQLGLAVYYEKEIHAKLVYAFRFIEEDEEIILGWLGGIPAMPGDFAEAEYRLGLTLPKPYQQFTRVHNGFNLYPLDVGIHSTDALWLISEYAEYHPQYDPTRLLAFSGDGSGNQQCFYLISSTKDDSYLTYDWDHDTFQMTHPLTFTEYINQLVESELLGAITRQLAG